MLVEKFQTEIKTLEKFFTQFCKDKHYTQYLKVYDLEYKNNLFQFEINLCEECHALISYSFDRLKECPHEIKPRCRNCPNPCYEKKEWKSLSKIMRYGGIKASLGKIFKV